MTDANIQPTGEPVQPAEPGDATAAYPANESAEEIVRILDQYLAELEAGTAPAREKLLAQYPALASQLEPCLSGIEFIHRAARPTADAPSRLGDFEIVREVGHGGMGVVYEAQQLSLKRKVALKVLRFAGVADREAMERFQREAETVALLHHTNIVPIFAVGEHQGVFYYAMQFIEGRSLAAVLEQSQKEAAPLDMIEVARWALQAAEALAHAHQRNVIHRDVKPSNLILDPAGQVWLTDFGLAKRIDDAALSMTGAMLGTPRYMSPEQASATKLPVDQRTDIYSLGVTLYELATGKPLFEADSWRGIISQVLTTEPPSPRSLRTGLPRDLETIILKCLAKEPQQRYATAQALADDLRAFCEGRAIKARRAGIAERTVRWAKRHKKGAALAAATAAVTLLIAVASFAALRWVTNARLAHLSLATEGPDQSFKVEVLDEAEKTTVAVFTAPTQQAQSIPAGRYHVRLTKPGELSETALLDARAGQSCNTIASLTHRQLWELSVNDYVAVELARLEGRDDVLLGDRDLLRRINGATGEPIWQVSLANDQPIVRNAMPKDVSYPYSFFWPNIKGTSGNNWEPPCLVRPLVDLDGDGMPDLIWGSRSWSALAAVSGKTGKPLWFHPCQGDLPRDEQLLRAAIVGQPLLTESGGKKTLVALYALNSGWITLKNGKTIDSIKQLWLEGINARSGEKIWQRRLEWFDRVTQKYPRYAAATLKRDGRTIGVIACENRLYDFDMLTGQPAWPERKLPGALLKVQFADLRGDGCLQMLVLDETHAPGTSVTETVIGSSNEPASPDLFAIGKGAELRLTVYSADSAAPLWQRALPHVVSPLGNLDNSQWTTADWDWPLVVDLGAKGKLSIIIPYVDVDARVCGLEVLDGSTGNTQWQKRLDKPSTAGNWRTPQPDRIIVGPDLNGDGCREIFAASYSEGSERLYIDALSGKDGVLLWSNQEIVLPRWQAGVFPMRWWQPGRDGWPLLVVAYGNSLHSGFPANVVAVAASTGRIEHSIERFGLPEVADVNGDGLPDLLSLDTSTRWQNGGAGKIRALKGLPPTAWRTLGRTLAAETDFNGDGFTDLIDLDERSAISGRDASVLWRSNAPPPADARRLQSGPLPDADLNGDGAPDLVSTANGSSKPGTLPLTATSGRDGSRLWTVDLVMSEDSSISANTWCPPHLAGHVLEAGKLPDVLVLYQRQRHSTPKNTASPWQELLQTRLARLSGGEGHTVWEQPLGEPANVIFGQLKVPFALVDLDGDGVKDIVFWLPVPQDEEPVAAKGPPEETKSPMRPPQPLFELRAHSGKDGKLLWRRTGFVSGMRRDLLQFLGGIPAPAVCDPKGDGHPLVLVADQTLPPKGETGIRGAIVALDGKSGDERWTWFAEGSSLNTREGPWERPQSWSNASPQIARTAKGPAIVVSAYNESLRMRSDPKTKARVSVASDKTGNEIVVLSTAGDVLQKFEEEDPAYVRQGMFFQYQRPRLWVHDLQGNGQDAIAWSAPHCVRALLPTFPGLLWESLRLPQELPSIQAIQPAGRAFPATIVAGDTNGAVGLAGPTGKVRWRCDVDNTTLRGILQTHDPRGLPWIWSQSSGNEQSARMAVATDDAGLYVPPNPSPLSFAPVSFDRRWLRPLPWTPQPGENWSVSGLAVVQAALLLVSIVGWWPGRLRRAAWLLGLWLVPWLGIELVRWAMDMRLMDPDEHYDWSTWRQLDQSATARLLLFVMLIAVGWWLVRLTRWIIGRYRMPRKLIAHSGKT